MICTSLIIPYGDSQKIAVGYQLPLLWDMPCGVETDLEKMSYLGRPGIVLLLLSVIFWEGNLETRLGFIPHAIQSLSFG